ncbi:acylneuraminate cytidylyltransferase family protein [Acinetobacter radioresistens]|uniref:acylneuraminate cytidylyltransferase family protein n=1 Tax=Acinetobacter radioresistens TaxID=40216 RepID=UPI00157BB427|nr:acylneuraminate cytidylyltransferase family protein [Acinetobacter radioresistens]NTY98319.1 acylneuraminate cytidylyltransferase family protein [Acinetobacter radioresistens]
MLEQYHVTALIPARGGSQRLPRKNVKILYGKPLIAWTIDVAKESKYIDSIVVSTDDIEIKDIAEKFGARVPFLRPKELSTDIASSFDVVKHAIEFLNINKENHLIILLQPTSPLRTVEELDRALELFIKKKASGVVSVSECEYSPLWANTLPESLSMSEFIRPEVQGKRSQDLPTYYRLNGSIYIYNINKLLESNSIFFDTNVYGYETNKNTSVDIDDELDFKLAQLLLDGYSVDE